MATLTLVDRQLLGDVGLALDDDAFIQIVAGMGQSSYSRESSARGAETLIGWSLHNFLNNRERLELRASRSDLSQFRDTWLASIAESSEKRIVIDFGDFSQGPDLASIVRILNHQAAGTNSVFIVKEIRHADLRWQWPLRIGAQKQDLKRFDFVRLAEMWPAKGLTEINALGREQARCEILVMEGSIPEALRRVLALRHRIRSGHLILFGPIDVPWSSLGSHVDALLSEAQAAALSVVTCPPEEVTRRLNWFVEELSHNHPYDLALAVAFPRQSSIHFVDLRLLDAAALTTVARELGRSVRALPPNAPLSIPHEALKRAITGWTPANGRTALTEALEANGGAMSFEGESQGASGLRAVSDAVRRARSETAREETARFLQGDLFMLVEGDTVRERRGFVVGRHYRLDVFIGPRGEGTISADEAFDETQLDWRRRHSHRLQVLFAEPRQWREPLSGTLELRREGTSTKCPFLFIPSEPGPFAGRVTVYHRGRVLQTALLKSTVFDSAAALATIETTEPLRLSNESRIRRSLGTLDERRRFDAFLILNHTTDNTPTATAAGTHGAFIASLDTVRPQLAAINSLMNDVANNASRYAKGLMSEGNADLLCKLALEGHWVYRNLVLNYLYESSAARTLREAKYLQIVSTRPDEPVPLEFVYDYPPPDDNSPVCKNAARALRTGRCPSRCKPKTAPAAHVCPLGFWGLSRVIERHEIDPDRQEPSFPAAAAEVRSEPIGGRDILSLNGASLVAVSEQVPAHARTALETALKKTWGGKVVPVRNWKHWVEVVHEVHPVMLLVLPHSVGTAAQISLEISGKVLKSAFINGTYVNPDPEANGPLVILLGCDTTSAADTGSYSRHVTVFRQADAALVLGTVAIVLGVDAAEVAAKMVEQLVATSTNATERFGEVFRQVKRDAVANSQMLAMCLVAFGDADWRLK